MGLLKVLGSHEADMMLQWKLLFPAKRLCWGAAAIWASGSFELAEYLEFIDLDSVIGVAKKVSQVSNLPG